MHWHKTQVSIHSGILEVDGEKFYHPYFSDDRIHDQEFVIETIREILVNVEIPPGETMIIVSDNCSSQYKSALHFYHLLQLSKMLNVKIIRIYGVAGHGKSDVNCVWGGGGGG